jgi:hypothetical protein
MTNQAFTVGLQFRCWYGLCATFQKEYSIILCQQFADHTSAPTLPHLQKLLWVFLLHEFVQELGIFGLSVFPLARLSVPLGVVLHVGWQRIYLLFILCQLLKCILTCKLCLRSLHVFYVLVMSTWLVGRSSTERVRSKIRDSGEDQRGCMLFMQRRWSIMPGIIGSGWLCALSDIPLLPSGAKSLLISSQGTHNQMSTCFFSCCSLLMPKRL